MDKTELLRRLIERRNTAAAELETLEAQRRAITDLVASEARDDLNPEEDAEFRARTADIGAKQRDIASLDERIAELSEEIERSGRLNQAAAAVRRAQALVQSVNEEKTYRRHGPHSYLRDVAMVQLRLDGSGESQERLRRHAQDVATAPEYRDLSRVDGSGGFFVPPAWLMQLYAPLARAGRAYANLVSQQPLPPGTDTINVPRIVTGTQTAIQTADNAATQETDLVDASVPAPVRTVTGYQDVARQLLDQSPINFDEVVYADLLADLEARLDAQVISGTGLNFQVQGVRATPGIETITATAATAPASSIPIVYAKLADAVQRVHTQRFQPPTVIVMHPRRWAWFNAAFASDGRPAVVPSGPGVNAIATLGAVAAEQVVGNMHGLPVVTDPNMPTNVGTDQDVIHVIRASDLMLFEGGTFVQTDQGLGVGSANLTVRLQVGRYLAFTAGRYPKAIVEITGTALAAPSF